MFNIKPTEEEHKIYQYLLYVATSRAITMMFVCTYTNTHGGYLNHHITKVPSDAYLTHPPVKIPNLSFRKTCEGQMINGITELISNLSDKNLDMIHDILKIDETEKLFTRRIYPDFTDIDRGKDEALFGIFCEEIFFLQYCSVGFLRFSKESFVFGDFYIYGTFFLFKNMMFLLL